MKTEWTSHRLSSLSLRYCSSTIHNSLSPCGALVLHSFIARYWQMVEDRLLIWRFKQGNRDALRRIYEKYKNDLLKLAVALVNDVNAAEDVVQDVFVSFAQSAPGIQPRGNLKKYLATCVTNRIRNRRRDLQRHAASAIDNSDCALCDRRSPEQWAILSEELALLSDAMAQIPYEQREVIGLSMQGNMTFRQIGRAIWLGLFSSRLSVSSNSSTAQRRSFENLSQLGIVPYNTLNNT